MCWFPSGVLPPAATSQVLKSVVLPCQEVPGQRGLCLFAWAPEKLPVRPHPPHPPCQGQRVRAALLGQAFLQPLPRMQAVVPPHSLPMPLLLQGCASLHQLPFPGSPWPTRQPRPSKNCSISAAEAIGPQLCASRRSTHVQCPCTWPHSARAPQLFPRITFPRAFLWQRPDPR